jgi:hypothetical protein
LLVVLPGLGSQGPQGATAYENTTHQGSELTTPGPWPNEPLNSFSNVGTQSFNQSSMSVPLVGNTLEQMKGLSSNMNDFPSPGTSRTNAKPNSKRPTSRISNSRDRKLRMRRSPPRRSMQTAVTASQSFDRRPNSTVKTDTLKTRKVEPQEAIALFEESIQPFSIFSQLKAADLINQLKQLVLEEQKYGRSSQPGASEVNVSSTAPSTQDSVSNPEVVDSESLTDNTSVSSTPQKPAKDAEDTEDSMSIDEEQNEAKHEPCTHCGVKTLYYCTRKNCGYGTHSFADYKRHEEGDKHWPQDRFMCLECPANPAPSMNGEPVCEYCLVPLSHLGGSMRSHYLQCETARKDCTTFSRKDHLINHLRKDHGMINMNQIVSNWRYAIDSKWPRQCGFCGVMFQNWAHRMKHLGEHFQEGLDMSSWKLPFSKSTDSRPQGPHPPKDDDDDDDDNSNGSGGRSWGKAIGQHNTQNNRPSTQSQANNASGSRHTQKSSSHTRQRKVDIKDETPNESEQQNIMDSVEVAKTSLTLERYLNDTASDAVATRLTLGESDVPVPPKPSRASSRKAANRDSKASIQPKVAPPSSKKSISKSTYQRPKHDRIFCDQCINHPDGFRGEHELRRHKDREHRATESTNNVLSARVSNDREELDFLLYPDPQTMYSCSPFPRPKYLSMDVPYTYPGPQETYPVSTALYEYALEPPEPRVAPSSYLTASGPSASSPSMGLPHSTHIAPVPEWAHLGLLPTPEDNQYSFFGPIFQPDYEFQDQNFVDPLLLLGPSCLGEATVKLESATDLNSQYNQKALGLDAKERHSPFLDCSLYPYPPPQQPSSTLSFSSRDDYSTQSTAKGRCTYPECGKVFKDLKAHMLTHQTERPEKCPIQTCDYHIKGFARKYDKNRHTLTHYKGTMVCGFCPGSGSAAEKSFNRADVLKRHLTSVHGVEQTPPNSRKRPLANTATKLSGYSPDATGKCSTCSGTFCNAQDFYEHLDDCVLRIVQQDSPDIPKSSPDELGACFDLERKQYLTAHFDIGSNVNLISRDCK